MKYCVTGGSGFIGEYFCHALKDQGHEVVIIDLVEPGDIPHDRYVKGDIRDIDACRVAVTGCDRMIHLAAAHHDFGIDRDTFFSVNEGAAKTLCTAMDEAGIRDLAFYSTVAVYGSAPPPLAETTTPQPESDYGASKLAGETLFQEWTEQGEGRRCLVIRPTVTFGPRNFANMYSLIRQINGRKFFFVGRGDNIKSLSYIENILDATMYLMDKDDLPAFDVYNYVEKPDMDSRTIAVTVYEALGKKVPRWSIPMWFARLLALPFDVVIGITGKNLPVSGARVKKLFADQTKFEADKVLRAGFTPRIPLGDAITTMVDWYVERGQYESGEWHQPPRETVTLERRV